MISIELRKKMDEYVSEVKKIYGSYLSKIILYGSYARGDNNDDSDIDIMILIDMDDIEIKKYRKTLSYMTCDFNLDNDVEISPYAKSLAHFKKWVNDYPYYNSINEEGVLLYGAA